MATKSRIQRVWDIIRGKRGWGAVVNIDDDAIPTHYGAHYIYSGEPANRIFREFIESERPGFVSRIGRTELKAVSEFLNSIRKPQPTFSDEWRRRMKVQAGFFTPTDAMLTRFGCETLTMTREADIFCVYHAVRGEEILCRDYLPAESFVCNFGPMYPFYFENPWTESLAGKKVLVVHPFAKTIVKQYEKRELLFADPKVLPQFQLSVIQAVQSSANNKCEFPDWFAALDHMNAQISEVDFDVALIGAGAYGPFLAHHCKKIGKKGIQMASGVQLLFGIKGKRWTEPKSGQPFEFINEHWVFPSEDERPANPELVEGGCYW